MKLKDKVDTQQLKAKFNEICKYDCKKEKAMLYYSDP